jgi:predicted  nucleic acid-binding Zn-ribbon protein
LGYSGDRPPPWSDVRDAIDQLEAIVRDVTEELAGWRSRAQKAEAELKARGSPVKNTELESENKALRQRVDGARTRVHDLMQRLTFLEEQARDNGGGAGGGGSHK